MNIKNMIAVILITLGIVVLAFAGITFTTPGETIQLLGVHIETTQSHFIPPMAGALILIGGIALLFMKAKQLE